MESRMGHRRFLILYLVSGFAGNVFSFYFSCIWGIDRDIRLAGCRRGFPLSQQGTLRRARKKAFSNIITIAAVNLFIGLYPGIDNWGHVGGL